MNLYADGACSGNPGPGGWGAILTHADRELELSGFEAATTNNRMELTAVIIGLSALKAPCNVTVYSDSKYIVDSIEKGWLKCWVKNGWKNSQKKTPPNDDLWKKLLVLLDTHEVSFVWIKGHDGHPYNERCDRLAVAEYQNHK